MSDSNYQQLEIEEPRPQATNSSQRAGLNQEQRNTGNEPSSLHLKATIAQTIFIFAFLLLDVNLVAYTISTYEYYDITELQDTAKIFRSLADNLEAKPINDIVTAGSEDCPADYQLLNLYDYRGSREGCYCPRTGTILEGSCTSSEPNDCETFPATIKENFNIWSDNKLCAKTVSDFDYVYESNCPSGMRRCSTILCVPTQDACPITDIGNEVEESQFLYKTLVLSDSYTLDVYQNPLKPSIIDLEISISTLPCISDTDLPKAEGYEPFSLFESSVIGCPPNGTDDSAQIINQTSAADIFYWNGYGWAIDQITPLKQSLTDQPAYLVYRPKFINTDSKNIRPCLEIDNDYILEVSLLLEKLNAHIVTFAEVLVLGILLYGGTLLVCLVITGCDYGKMSMMVDKNAMFLIFLPLLALTIGHVCHTLAIHNENVQLSNYNSMLTIMIEDRCFSSENLNAQIRDLNSHLEVALSQIVSQLAVTNWITAIFLIFASMFKFIISKCTNS